MGVYDRQIAAAKRVIAKKGQAVLWHKPRAVAPGGDPWNPQAAGAAPAGTPVSIAFFQPRELGRGGEEFLRSIIDTEIPTGSEIGLMAGGLPFTPEITDRIERTAGKFTAITKIDRLAPNGEPILYYVTIAT